MLVFSKGSSWGEDLFKSIFGTESFETDVFEEIKIEENDISFNISNEEQFFPNGIVVKINHTEKISSSKEVKKETSKIKNLSLPVVIRLFHKKIPLSEIDQIGETSEVLLSSDKELEVELLVNGDVIGKGIIKKKDNNYKLRITELFV